ncbi:unnamed protein product [Brassica oleracea var. botrytis]|uniref:(rape) hypothetical protein n=1 Tax=Brassica napus TaxID=3708 RepID=A0A078F422_BRANA|nr:unnamed protein product [Brassica napus]CDY07804.1 BnaC03g48180D [Brassica napus]
MVLSLWLHHLLSQRLSGSNRHARLRFLVFLSILMFEQIKPRATLPPLRDRRAERLHYLGFSFGLTLDLFRFWRKHKFAPFYISQLPDQSAVTDEHTYFRVRFSKLLSDKFKKMDYKLAMRLTLTLFLFHANLLLAENIGLAKIDAARMMDDQNQTLKYTLCPVQTLCYGRLWKYRTNILNRWQNYRKYVSFITIFRPEEYSVCVISRSFQVFTIQSLLHFPIVFTKLPLLLFLKTSTEVESTFPRLEERVLEPHNVSVDEDLRESAKQVEEHMRSQIEFHPGLLEQFAIGGKEADALEKSKISSSGGSSLHQYRDYQIF